MKPASRVTTIVSWCFETQSAHESSSHTNWQNFSAILEMAWFNNTREKWTIAIARFRQFVKVYYKRRCKYAISASILTPEIDKLRFSTLSCLADERSRKFLRQVPGKIIAFTINIHGKPVAKCLAPKSRRDICSKTKTITQLCICIWDPSLIFMFSQDECKIAFSFREKPKCLTRAYVFNLVCVSHVHSVVLVGHVAN